MSKRKIDNISSLDRSELSTGTANHVLINSSTGTLSSEATLAPSRGGHGTSMSSSTGFARWTTGVITSVGLINNADIASGANIADSKLATISTSGKVSNSATTATSSNTNGTIVLRNASTGYADIKGVNLLTTGGTSAVLDYFETQVFTIEFVNNTTQSLTVYAQRIGKLVSLIFPDAVSSTGKGAGNISTATGALPSRFCPIYNFLFPNVSTLDNGSRDIGLLQIDSGGQITVFKEKTALGSFSGVGAQGFSSFSCSYLVA